MRRCERFLVEAEVSWLGDVLSEGRGKGRDPRGCGGHDPAGAAASVSIEIAYRPSRAFGSAPEIRLGMQLTVDLAQSRDALLLSLRDRGVKPAKLAVGDGTLGFWAALSDVYPQTDEQRC